MNPEESKNFTGTRSEQRARELVEIREQLLQAAVKAIETYSAWLMDYASDSKRCASVNAGRVMETLALRISEAEEARKKVANSLRAESEYLRFLGGIETRKDFVDLEEQVSLIALGFQPFPDVPGIICRRPRRGFVGKLVNDLDSMIGANPASDGTIRDFSSKREHETDTTIPGKSGDFTDNDSGVTVDSDLEILESNLDTDLPGIHESSSLVDGLGQTQSTKEETPESAGTQGKPGENAGTQSPAADTPASGKQVA